MTDLVEALPGVFCQEPHGDIEGRPAPAFERKELRQCPRIGAGDLDDIVGPHAGGEQRLVAVPHGGVGHQDTLFVAHPFTEFLRAQLVELLLGPVDDGTIRIGHARRGDIFGGPRPVAGLGMAVDGHISKIG